MDGPLNGVTIIDFSQFLAGPFASLRLLDLGARVIKVENPDGGDLCRNHYLSNTRIKGDSTIFHAINRGKESIALDLKTPGGLAAAKRLINRADVMMHNFRPGVIDRLGLGYYFVREFKPDVVYGSISGYGNDGDWKNLPGQDLLAQARSGAMWLSGNADQGPVPLGIPIADMAAGSNLCQGLLAALFRHARTGQGGIVETSLLEAMLDLQFEFLSTYLSNGRTAPDRLAKGSAHGYLAAPYGVYGTKDGFLALAMTPLDNLAEALELSDLGKMSKVKNAAFDQKEEVYSILSTRFKTDSAQHWETLLANKGVWCAEILDWDAMQQVNTVEALGMLPENPTDNPSNMAFLRSPIRLDNNRPSITKGAPSLNRDAEALSREFDLDL